MRDERERLGAPDFALEPRKTAVLVVNALLFLATLFVVYYLPGRLVLKHVFDDLEPEASFPLSLGLGLVIVNVPVVLVVGILSLVAKVFLTAPIVWAVGILVSGGVSLWAWRKGRKPLAGLWRRPSRNQIALLVVTALATLFYLAHFDEDLLREEACNLRMSTSMTSDLFTDDLLTTNKNYMHTSPYQFDAVGDVSPPGRPSWFTGWDGQRLGPSVLLAPFSQLFGTFGYRMVYALQGLLLPGLGFLLGWYVFRRRDAAWALAILLTFNPYALDARFFDENHIANIFGALTLVFLLRPKPAPVLAAIACSLFLGTRHVEALVLPFVLLYLWKTSEEPRRATLRFVGTLTLFSVPYIAMHVMEFASDGVWFESLMERAPVPHSFFGIEFESTALWNWPFIEQPLRAPHHALPTLVQVPLDFARRFGVLLTALIPLGVYQAWRSSRSRTFLLAGWAFPIFLLVMVMSNWVEENKLGVPASSLAPVVLFIVAGGVAFVDKGLGWVARIGFAVGGLLVVGGGVLALQGMAFERDDRILEYTEEALEPGLFGDIAFHTPENPDYVEWDRSRYEMRLLPRLGSDHSFAGPVVLRDIARMADNLARPSFSQYERKLPDFTRSILEAYYVGINGLSLRRLIELGETGPGLAPLPLALEGQPAELVPEEELVDVVLELSTSPILAEQPVKLATAPIPDAIKVDGSAFVEVALFQTNWGHPDGETLLMAHEKNGSTYLFLTPARMLSERVPPELVHERHDANDYEDLALPLRLPKHSVIRLFEFRSFRPPRWYARYIYIDDDGIWMSEAVALSPA